MSRDEEARIIEALKNGDEDEFMRLVDMLQPSLLRMAAMIVNDDTVAQEVVQETWIAVLKGLPNFEGRSSLKTWIFTILMNRARTVAKREGRYVGLALDTDADETSEHEAAVPADRFTSHHPHHWITPPRAWEDLPEEYLDSAEVRDQIRAAIDALPPQQREVITLRDVEELSAEDACNILGISESNQRVLLHRARARVRRALERYFGE